VIAVALDRMHDPSRHTRLLEDGLAVLGVAVGVALVVEVVKQPGDRPLLLVAIEALGESAHRGFDREAVLAEAVALRVLAEQRVRRVAIHRRDLIIVA
jgi:hypothetical protein